MKYRELTMILKYLYTYSESEGTNNETYNKIKGLHTNKHGVGFLKGEGDVSGFTCG